MMIKLTSLNSAFVFVLILFYTVSCVPTSQLRAVKNDNIEMAKELENLQLEHHKIEIMNEEFSSLLNDQKTFIGNMEDEIYKLEMNYKDASTKHQRLFKLNELLIEKQTELTQEQQKEARKLLSEIQITQQNLQIHEDNIHNIKKMLNNKENKITNLQGTIGEKDEELMVKNAEITSKNKRLVKLENSLYKRDSITSALKKTIQKALIGFKKEELNVHKKNGKVYISMEEKLLFQLGEYHVDEKGLNAIKKLGATLENNPNINIMIEGHTDNLPYIIDKSDIKTKKIIDNWDLSVKRATEIVRLLLHHSTINPERVIAAGRAEFSPVVSNDTEESRAKNRRIEIILAPKLDEIFEILDTEHIITQ